MSIDFDPMMRPNGTFAAFEGKTLEYKRDLASKERIVRTLVAFANSAGGSLVVGVDDDHSIVGVADPLIEENRLSNMIADSISPVLRPEVEIITVGDSVLLVARVYPAGQRPYFVTAEGERNGVYLRLGSSTLRADQWQIAELRRQSNGVCFDELPCQRDESGLDEDAVARAFPGRDVESAQSVLQLMTIDQGKTVSTNGGVLLFGRDRERLFPDAWVQCGRFRGPQGLDLVDQVELYAPLLDLPGLVEDFLKKHAFRGADLSEWKRKDDWSVPIDILREATINALVHSDYGQRGGPIRVAFYDDRVYVESLGGLLPGMTLDMMRTGVSRIRNQVIARAFREAHMIEQWGYGVRRMYDRAAALGLPEPSYVELPGRLRFIVPTRHAQIMMENPEEVTKLPGEVTKTVTKIPNDVTKILDEVTKLPDGVTKIHLRLLQALVGQTLTRSELMGVIGVTDQSANVKRHLKPLISAGLVSMSSPDKPTSRSQRYGLTDAGRAFLGQRGTDFYGFSPLPHRGVVVSDDIVNEIRDGEEI